jgi:hypothetical protein
VVSTVEIFMARLQVSFYVTKLNKSFEQEHCKGGAIFNKLFPEYKKDLAHFGPQENVL